MLYINSLDYSKIGAPHKSECKHESYSWKLVSDKVSASYWGPRTVFLALATILPCHGPTHPHYSLDSFYLINGILPTTAVIKGCQSHQWLQPLSSSELVCPEGTQEEKEYLPSIRHQTIATPCGEPWGNSACENTGCWPQTEEFIKGLILVPRLLYLPIHRKMLNSITWHNWFL